MMSDSVAIYRAWICLLVGDDVHGRVEFTRQVAVNGAIAAGVVTKPVENQLQVVLLGHALRVV